MSELRPYQHEVLDFADRAGDRFVYADAAGSGKTPTTVAWLATKQPSPYPSLVVAPDSVGDQWLAQIPAWSDLRPINGRGPKRHDELARVESGDVFVTNYELLRRDQDALVKIQWDAVVFDEAHRLKGRTTQVALASRRLKAGGIACLTGTPLLNSADELWQMLHLCSPKDYRSFWRWARLHFYVEMTTHFGKVQHPIPEILGLKEGAAEAIIAEAKGVMICRTIDELLPGLPPVQTHIVPVDLGPAERALYDAVASKKGWGRHKETTIRVPNAVARMTRLRQMSSDWNGLLDESDGAGAKVTTAIELLDGNTEQAVVLTAYKHTARLIAESTQSAVLYTGDESKKERKHAVEQFAKGDAQVIVGTTAAMGEGVDGLQVAHRMVRLDRDWTPARNEQVVARIRRSGQQAPRIHVVEIVARDTVDQRVAEALARKEDIISAILG